MQSKFILKAVLAAVASVFSTAYGYAPSQAQPNPDTENAVIEAAILLLKSGQIEFDRTGRAVVKRDLVKTLRSEGLVTDVQARPSTFTPDLFN